MANELRPVEVGLGGGKLSLRGGFGLTGVKPLLDSTTAENGVVKMEGAAWALCGLPLGVGGKFEPVMP